MTIIPIEGRAHMSLPLAKSGKLSRIKALASLSIPKDTLLGVHSRIYWEAQASNTGVTLLERRPRIVFSAKAVLSKSPRRELLNYTMQLFQADGSDAIDPLHHTGRTTSPTSGMTTEKIGMGLSRSKQ